MFTEDQLLPISALQHLLFCERQCALIHLERLWAENRQTVEGQHLHKKAHAAPSETRNGMRITRGMPLCSYEFGLYGVADVIEWNPPVVKSADSSARRTLRQQVVAATREELALWTILPVEYKRGKPKTNDCDRVQLCAQAICLEEMLSGAKISCGALYYGKNRYRHDVEFNDSLREKTILVTSRFHEMIAARITPLAKYEKKCDTCSLRELCLPPTTKRPNSATGYFERSLISVCQETY